MNLEMKNIAKVRSANIEIDGISVIAGYNSTGKSTVGKALYCIFNNFYETTNTIEKYRVNAISDELRKAVFYISYVERKDNTISKMVLELFQKNMLNFESLMSLLKECFTEFGDGFSDTEIEEMIGEEEKNALAQAIEKLKSLLSISDEEILKTRLERYFNAEFGNQIQSAYEEQPTSSIILTTKGNPLEIEIKDNKIAAMSTIDNRTTEVIYIDTFDVIDLDINFNRYYRRLNNFQDGHDHKYHLLKSFNNPRDEEFLQKIAADKVVEQVLEKISHIIPGTVVGERKTLKYIEKIGGKEVKQNLEHLSSGMRTFLVLKVLLENNAIQENGTIILDEPEVRLHPIWQLKLAEIIVLLQKELGLHILLNTHSPYFLDAIETYSKKYGIHEKCNYYYAEEKENGVEIKDVTNNIKQIYKKFSEPYQILEDEETNDAETTVDNAEA